MAVKLQIRRGTSTEWGSSTEILSAGELVWASDTLQFKVGDGTKTWAQLEYVAGPTGAAGAGLAAGGTVGQLLIKTGVSDYATGWTSSFVTSVNGSSGEITGLAPTASPTFTGIVNFTSSSLNLGSGYASKYLAADSSGRLTVGATAISSPIQNTLALRDGSGQLAATSFIGSSVILTGAGYNQTVFPSATLVTGGNHSFYLPQLPAAPYTATLISNADSKTVSTSMLADTSVTEIKLADNSVTSNKIVNGTIVNEDLSATANIAVTKLSASSVTINGTSVTLGNSITITAVPNDASVTDIKIASTLSPSKITGTAVTQADNGTVTNLMLAGSIAPAKITGTAVTLNSANVFAAPSNLTPVTIKGYGATISPANLQEWWTSVPSASASAWVTANGTLVSKVGINAGLVPTTGTLGILTVQPDGETSGKGLVIRRSGTGNVFEVQEANTGSALFIMDYQGLIKAPSPSQSALKISDYGSSFTNVTINSGSYDSATQTLTLGCLSSTGLSNGAKVTFSSFIGDLAFLNAGTYTMIYSGTGTAFTIKYATDISPTDFPTSGAYAYGTLPGQSVDIQKWQVVGDANVSGVDSSGYLYSTKFYTRYVPNLSSSTGYNGYAGSTADLISKSLGVYDTTGKNQIFGNTTIGYAISSSNANPVGTQYGVLQVFKQSAGTGTSSVLAVRATSGTGWLQTWMAGTTSKANMDMTGSLTLSGSLTSSGSISATSGSLTVSSGSVSNLLSAGSLSATTGITSGTATLVSNETGGVSASGIIRAPHLEVDSFTPVNTSGVGANYNTLTMTTLALSATLPLNAKVRVYACTDTAYNIVEGDWFEGTVTSVTGTVFITSTVTPTLRGPKAGTTYAGKTAPTTDTNYLKVVPISLYSDSEIRTTSAVSVGAEGTKLKRQWAGSSSVTFTSGSGTLVYGPTLPVTPSSVSAIAVSSSTAISFTLSGAPTTTYISLKGWTGASAVVDGSYTIYWTAIE